MDDSLLVGRACIRATPYTAKFDMAWCDRWETWQHWLAQTGALRSAESVSGITYVKHATPMPQQSNSPNSTARSCVNTFRMTGSWTSRHIRPFVKVSRSTSHREMPASRCVTRTAAAGAPRWHLPYLKCVILGSWNRKWERACQRCNAALAGRLPSADHSYLRLCLPDYSSAPRGQQCLIYTFDTLMLWDFDVHAATDGRTSLR